MEKENDKVLLTKIANEFDLMANHEVNKQAGVIAEMLVDGGYLVKSFFPERNETIYAIKVDK